MPKITQLGATHHVDPAPAPSDPGIAEDGTLVEEAAVETVVVDEHGDDAAAVADTPAEAPAAPTAKGRARG